MDVNQIAEVWDGTGSGAGCCPAGVDAVGCGVLARAVEERGRGPVGLAVVVGDRVHAAPVAGASGARVACARSELFEHSRADPSLERSQVPVDAAAVAAVVAVAAVDVVTDAAVAERAQLWHVLQAPLQPKQQREVHLVLRRERCVLECLFWLDEQSVCHPRIVCRRVSAGSVYELPVDCGERDDERDDGPLLQTHLHPPTFRSKYQWMFQ